MLGPQYVSKGVCRCWHCRVSTAWPWRMGADWLPWCRYRVVCPFTPGRGIGPEPVRWTMCFLLTTSSLAWTLMIVCASVYIYMYIYISYIYNCVFGSLISDATCNYVSADGGRDVLWWPALPGHWLSYTGCWLSLLIMYWLLCLGCGFYFQPPP